MLEPFLFITYINDIVCNLNSKIQVFADDAVMYREILSSQDEVIFQNDIHSVSDWAKPWKMRLMINAMLCLQLDPTQNGA